MLCYSVLCVCASAYTESINALQFGNYSEAPKDSAQPWRRMRGWKWRPEWHARRVAHFLCTQIAKSATRPVFLLILWWLSDGQYRLMAGRLTVGNWVIVRLASALTSIHVFLCWHNNWESLYSFERFAVNLDYFNCICCRLFVCCLQIRNRARKRSFPALFEHLNGTPSFIKKSTKRVKLAMHHSFRY